MLSKLLMSWPAFIAWSCTRLYLNSFILDIAQIHLKIQCQTISIKNFMVGSNTMTPQFRNRLICDKWSYVIKNQQNVQMPRIAMTFPLGLCYCDILERLLTFCKVALLLKISFQFSQEQLCIQKGLLTISHHVFISDRNPLTLGRVCGIAPY